MPKNFGELECADCGARVKKNGPSQRYCEPCSAKRQSATQLDWARRHGQETYAKNRSERIAEGSLIRSATLEAGKQNSTSRSIAWMDESPADLKWMVRVAIPFSYAMSKNAIWRFSRRGHVFLRKESRSKHDAVMMMVRRALGLRKVVQNRVWLDIFVQKPDHRGDAVNVIDMVCDAVKVATGVDDRWFSIRRLDWEICKNDPKIYVGIGQESEEPVGACSACGRIMPFEAFSKAKHTPSGIARECRECRSAGRKAIRA